MTDAKGATAPGFLRDSDEFKTWWAAICPADAGSIPHEQWLWLAEWLDRECERAELRNQHKNSLSKYKMAAAGCRLLHEQLREPGDG